VGIPADLFGAIRTAFFLSLKCTCFIIILRSLLTEVLSYRGQNYKPKTIKALTSSNMERPQAMKDRLRNSRRKIRRYRTKMSIGRKVNTSFFLPVSQIFQ